MKDRPRGNKDGRRNADPSRNTDQEVGILYAALLHSNLDITVPRILGSLLQNHILTFYLDGRCIAGIRGLRIFVLGPPLLISFIASAMFCFF